MLLSKLNLRAQSLRLKIEMFYQLWFQKKNIPETNWKWLAHFADVLLGSTDYSTSLDMWGVGCIFVEMITGMPTFPGIRDTYDQLDKIFKLLGTPTEDTWRGVTHLPGYKPQKLGNIDIAVLNQ